MNKRAADRKRHREMRRLGIKWRLTRGGVLFAYKKAKRIQLLEMRMDIPVDVLNLKG